MYNLFCIEHLFHSQVRGRECRAEVALAAGQRQGSKENADPGTKPPPPLKLNISSCLIPSPQLAPPSLCRLPSWPILHPRLQSHPRLILPTIRDSSLINMQPMTKFSRIFRGLWFLPGFVTLLIDISYSRFILNLPDEELSSLERICFQVEQA
jgi:Dcp2, box A domain